MIGGLLSLVLVASATTAEGEVTRAVEPVEKTSIALVTDDEAWQEAGFRVGLGYSLDVVEGLDGVVGGNHHTASLRLGVRLDTDWSLFTTLRYGFHGGAQGGLRFSATLEPTLQLGEHTSLAIGAGVAGLVIPATGAQTPKPDIVATLTYPGTSPLLGACSGLGVLALLRLDHQLVVSDLFATGPALQVDAQWTACSEPTGRSDPDTAEPIDLRQYWRNVGVSLGWLAWWR